MSLEELYERISAATCDQHGFAAEEAREAHIRAIVAYVYALKGRQ